MPAATVHPGGSLAHQRVLRQAAPDPEPAGRSRPSGAPRLRPRVRYAAGKDGARLARLRRAEAAEGRARKAALCAGVPPARAASASRRVWVVTAGRVPASVPMWSSRDAWLADHAVWADSAEGRTACGAVHMSRRAIVALAEAVAPLADHVTGRNVGLAQDTIGGLAGYCAKYVSRALHLWADAGLAFEGFRGGRFDGSNRTSVWHLVSRSGVASPELGSAAPEPVAESEIFRPPPSRRDRRSVTVSNHVPSAATAAPGINSLTAEDVRRRRRKRRPPGAAVSPEARSIGAWLAGHSHGLFHAPWRDDRDHSGGLAMALDRSGLDLLAWSGPAISAAFDADMRARGWYWPQRIEHPAAFLAARLRRLPVRPDGPPRDGGIAAGIDKNSTVETVPIPMRYVPEPPRPVLTAAQRARIAQAQAEIRDQLARRRQDRTAPSSPLQRAHRSPTRTAGITAAGDTCMVCAGEGGLARPWLPPARRVVCPTCWYNDPRSNARK